MSRNAAILINKILKGEDDQWAFLGVHPEMIGSDYRPLYNFIVKHYGRYGKLPDRKEVAKGFPKFRFLKGEEPLKFYADLVITEYQAAKLRDILGQVSQQYQEDLPTALKTFKEGADTLFRSSGVMKAVKFSEILKAAEKDILSGDLCKAEVSFGMPVLDADLIGMEKGDWALLAGTAASGKTWCLLKMAHNLAVTGYKVLFLSLELNNKIISRRLLSLDSRLNYDRMRKRQLTDDEMIRVRKSIHRKYPGDIEIISSINHNANEGRLGEIDSIYNKIRFYKPEIVLIDGIYLAMDMDKWGSTVNFANDFHAMLQSVATPAISTSQLKTVADAANPKLNDLAFTGAFQQATDFVFLLAKDAKARAQHEAVWTNGKAREATDCQQYIVEFNPGEQLELNKITADHAKNYLKEEDDDSESEKSGKPGKGLKRKKKSVQ